MGVKTVVLSVPGFEPGSVSFAEQDRPVVPDLGIDPQTGGSLVQHVCMLGTRVQFPEGALLPPTKFLHFVTWAGLRDWLID